MNTGVQVEDYLILYKNKTTPLYKKNKKKLSKNQMFRRFNFDLCQSTDSLLSIKNYLLKVKKRCPELIGILLDTNIIVHDITYIPTAPKEFDILCLESEIESYVNNATEDSLYWTTVKVKDSGNFVVHGKSIQKVIDILNQSKTIQEFFKKTQSEMIVKTLTQYHLSEKEKSYVHDPMTKVVNKTLTKDDITKYETNLYKEFYQKFQELHLTIDNIKTCETQILPKVSLVCPVTDTDLFYHTLMTFLRLEYPRHLLELVIVCDNPEFEKKLNLPEDSRIRLININNKNKLKLPLGYRLNMGVKHSSSDIVMHFFDTSNYNLNLKQTILHFLLSQKECITSIDTAFTDFKSSALTKVPDLANCIYTKRFWKKASFEEVCHNFFINSDIMFKWLSFRKDEVSFLPFVYFSFKLKLDASEVYNSTECLDLATVVDKPIKESFDIITKIFNHQNF